ncbi:MAG TPA: hypothetical protein VFO01_13010 [Trebonia sp.]|nr:hypothetical protein [Trebonia sp.]
MRTGDLQTGKAQLVEGSYVSFILAQIEGQFAAPNPNNPAGKPEPSKPIDMRMIADTSQMQQGSQALCVMPGSPYKAVAALAQAHAKVGVNTLHNIASVLPGSLLESNGYKLNPVTQVPEILPEMPGLLAEGAIPAAWLPGAVRHGGTAAVRCGRTGRLQPGPAGELPDRHDRRQRDLDSVAPEHGRGVPPRVPGGPAGRGHQPCRRAGGA